MNASDNIYTAEDLARYHAGTMPPAEMHALEKAALEDPFLSDALEGYAYADDAKGDITELQVALTEKTQTKKIAFFSGNNAWMRIAAMLILFAGIGYTFYRVNGDGKTTGIAKVDKKENTPAVQVFKADNNKAPALDTINLTKSSAAVSTLNATTGATTFSFATDSISGTYEKNHLMPTTDRYYAPVTKQAIPTITADEASANGNITSAETKPIQGEEIKLTTNSNATVSEMNGKFDVRNNQNNTNATVQYDGYARRDIQQNNAVYNNVATNADLKKESKTVNSKEEKNKLKKSASEKDYTADQVAGRIDPIDSVVFNEYLEKNIKPVKDSITHKPYVGKTVLSFTVNRKGQPENIKVETALCPPCDAQAIRLLEKGPKWIYGGGGKRRTVAVELEEETVSADNPE